MLVLSSRPLFSPLQNKQKVCPPLATRTTSLNLFRESIISPQTVTISNIMFQLLGVTILLHFLSTGNHTPQNIPAVTTLIIITQLQR